MRNTMAVSEVIENAPLSRYQKRIIAALLLLGLAEGINALSAGYALPALSAAYEAPAAAFSIIFVTALVGEMLSNSFLAPFGDRYGRRTMLRIGIILFAIAAIASFFANAVETLAACRFIAGVGIGAAVPSVYALGSDYSPTRVKGRVIAMLSLSISAGGSLIGLIAAGFIPAFGGPAFLFLCGVLPLTLLLITWQVVPESVEFLAEKGDERGVWRILQRISPDTVPAEFSTHHPQYVPAVAVRGARFAQLFRDGRAARTVMLWVVSFMALFNAYFIFSFLATVLVINGVSESAALLSVSVSTFGGMIGAVLLGYLMDRTSLGPAVGAIGAGIAIASLIAFTLVPPSTSEIVFIALGATLGFGAIGTTAVAQILATLVYPPTVRSTGLGWYSAIGRIGGLVAPVLIGVLLSSHASPGTMFGIATIPPAILAITLIIFTIRYRQLRDDDVDGSHLTAPVLASPGALSK